MLPVILTSAYLPPIHYFTKLYAAPYIIEERHDHYVKQTYRNRCVIAGPNGAQALTIPVEHGGMQKATTGEMRISEHGNWRHLHWNALVSAYDSSPYFFYYADDFRPFYEQHYEYLADFNAALMGKVCELLDLSPNIQVSSSYIDAIPSETDDFRELIRPKTDYAKDNHFRPVPYYQVFRERTGFLPNLSIVDLLFNMGPESRIVLRDSIVP